MNPNRRGQNHRTVHTCHSEKRHDSRDVCSPGSRTITNPLRLHDSGLSSKVNHTIHLTNRLEHPFIQHISRTHQEMRELLTKQLDCVPPNLAVIERDYVVALLQ